MENYNQQFRIGDWLVEPRLNRISQKTRQVGLRPQTMDLLVYLARRSGQVVSADKLIEDVWDGVTVSSGSVYNCIYELRQAFGDPKNANNYIETISKRGYRLVAVAAQVEEASIAVLPFLNLSSNREKDSLSNGISEVLLNVLSKVPNLHVAARTSSFQLKDRNLDITDIGQRLNVAHILEGSVRESGPQIRITAQLIDTRNGFHLWSEIYDREFKNIFALQDEISVAIVEALKGRLGLKEELPSRLIMDPPMPS